MADTLTDTGSHFSPFVGLVYVFNLIVGTGALTMPQAFGLAGWLVALIMIIILAFTSYMTVTFVIETMAAANAVRRVSRKVQDSDEDDSDIHGHLNHTERVPLLANSHGGVFEITDRIEMGQMASMFFNKVGLYGFYICLALYLYGDLAIYMVAIPKSLRDVVCTYSPSVNSTQCGAVLPNDAPCWPSSNLHRIDVYRILVVGFMLLLGPFVFFNVQRTKYLQLCTTLCRWLAFSMMIVLALVSIVGGRGEGHPPVARLSGIPNLFGVCVYSFMCHHSLPSLTTPIRDKKRIYSLLGLDYLLILMFYLVLSFTAIYTFDDIQDLYTLNFNEDSHCGGGSFPVHSIVFIQYFLALFPVFTLSTNLPIIGITLRNNLKVLFSYWAPYRWAVDRLVFPLAAILIPFGVALATDNVAILVGITGSYAGATIQYFIPAALVFYSRKYIEQNVKPQFGSIVNKYRSPFAHKTWIFGILIWGVLCISLVTVNYGLYGL